MHLVKKVASFFVPIRIKKEKDSNGNILELYVYQGRYQLGLNEVLYSDGRFYKPLVKAFNFIGIQSCANLKNILMLGGGLSSATAILAKKHFFPKFTIIEKEALIINWAQEIFKHNIALKNSYIHADAQDYLLNNTQLFDCLIVDVFIDKKVPAFITELNYLIACKNALNSKGFFILNFIETDENSWESVSQLLNKLYPNSKTISLEMNYVFIGIND